MSQISQLSKLAISVAVCITAGVPHTTSCSSATKLAACGHFHDKSTFLPFLPAPDTMQRWRQCSQKSMADIIYPKSGSGHLRQVLRLGRWAVWVGLAASYTQTSTDSNSTLLSSHILISSGTDSVQIRLVSLIHCSRLRCTEWDGTASKIPVQLVPLQV